jgi:hypothetical protein
MYPVMQNYCETPVFIQIVMAGLDPASTSYGRRPCQDVDARGKPGHDG